MSHFFERDHPFEDDFDITLNANIFSLDESPFRTSKFMVCYCVCGTAEIEIDILRYHIEQNCILSIFHNQVVSIINKSHDFKISFFEFSLSMFNVVVYGFPADFVSFLKNNARHQFPTQMAVKIKEMYASLYQKFNERDNICRAEIVTNMVRNHYLEIFNDVHRELSVDGVKLSRKNDLMRDFFNMIMANYTVSREVAFYAAKLCITPNYLSMITKDIEGRSAKDCINDFVVTEIKMKLKFTTNSLQAIAEEVGFSDQAFMCKFFKQRTKNTPSQWRKNKVLREM